MALLLCNCRSIAAKIARIHDVSASTALPLPLPPPLPCLARGSPPNPDNTRSRCCPVQVERQLAALHNQLHVNVAPRKQALELLRHKIEEENRQVGAGPWRASSCALAGAGAIGVRWGVHRLGRTWGGTWLHIRWHAGERTRGVLDAATACAAAPQIDAHRAAHAKAKAAMEAAAAALAAAEQRKAQLSEELTMLVLQSSGAQLRVRVLGRAARGGWRGAAARGNRRDGGMCCWLPLHLGSAAT